MSIVFDPIEHKYSDGAKEYISVTKLISTVIRKDIDGVDPAVLANAAERGIRTEAHATEILKTGYCTMTGERDDVIERVKCFYHFYEQEKPELLGYQEIVKDDVNGIAGQLDFRLQWGGKRVLVDMKATANPEASWRLQVGGYEEMYAEMFEPNDAVGVLHINPKFAKGWIWREYDPFIVRSQWRAAVEWWKVLKSLKAEA